jgi:hypothetical protein
MAIVEALLRKGMANQGARQPAAHVELHLAPVEAFLLAPPAEALIPTPSGFYA